MRKETRVNHPPKVKLPEGNEPVVAPIYQSVKFTYPTIDASRVGIARGGYYYTRGSNPTVRQLELTLAQMQGTEDALAFGSGMAAVSSCLLANLSAGDNVAMFVESYKPTRTLVREILPRFGITHSLLSVNDQRAIEETFAHEATKMVFFESPTNPMLRIHDMAQLIELAQRYNVITALDNTFAGFHNHGQFEIDYYVHSLTKFASGHGDVMGGLVAGSKQQVRPVRHLAIELGPVLDPGVAHTISRGLRTYFVRYRQQCASAQRIAEHLQADDRIRRVCYPGLPGDSEHALAKRQMEDFGAVLTFDVGEDQRQAWAFLDALQLFTTCASLGSAESLGAPAMLYLATDLSADDKKRSGVRENTVRLAVGLEHIDDLIEDLDRALDLVLN